MATGRRPPGYGISVIVKVYILFVHVFMSIQNLVPKRNKYVNKISGGNLKTFRSMLKQDDIYFCL